MPSKKKKYNARFPPARIKKIMQTDEEVGKVAAAVPVIISRALELFIDSLIEKTASVTREKHAKTLSASHIKQAIHSEKTFDFLRDLVKNVPDHQAEEEDGGLAPSGSGTQETKPKPIKPSRIRELHGSEKSPSKRGPGRPRKIKIVEKKEALSADNDSEETDTDEEQNNTERVQEPSQAGTPHFFSPPSSEPTQAGNQQFFSPPASEPTQAGDQHFFSPASTDDRLASSASPGQRTPAEHETHTPPTHALSTPPSQQPSEPQSVSMSAPSCTLQSQVTTQQANTVTSQPTQTSSNMPFIPPNMGHMQPPGPIHPHTVNPYPMHNMPIPPYPFPVQIPPYNPPPFIPNTALNNSNSSNPHLMPPMMPPFMPPFMNMPHQSGFYMPPLPPPGPEGGSYLQMLSDAAFRPPLSVGLEQSKAPPTHDNSHNTRKPDPPHSVQSGSSISGDTNMPLDMSLPSKSRSQRPTDSQEQTTPNSSNQNDFMPGTTHPPHNMLLPKTYNTSTTQNVSKTSVASDQNSSQNGPNINPTEGNGNSNDLKKSTVKSQSDEKSGSQIADNKCVPIKKQKNSDQNSIQYENLSNLMSQGPLKIVSNEDDDDYDT